MVLITRTLDTYDYDECIAIQYVFDKLGGEKTAIKHWRCGILLLTKQFISYMQFDKQFAYV